MSYDRDFLITAFAIRLFSVLRFESVIHEFDPYFNYRTTRYLAEKGFYSFHNWFDELAWYPLGRIIGGMCCLPLLQKAAVTYFRCNNFLQSQVQFIPV